MPAFATVAIVDARQSGTGSGGRVQFVTTHQSRERRDGAFPGITDPDAPPSRQKKTKNKKSKLQQFPGSPPP